MPFGLLAPDPRLPQRDALLDVAHVADRLCMQLGVPAHAHVGRIERVRTKYRVGQSLRVLHRLPVGAQTHLVSTRMATPERIARLAASAADGSWEVAGLRAVVHDPELDAVSWVFPFDRKLAGLPELVGDEAPLLARAGLDGRDVRVVAYAPEKSVTLRCHAARCADVYAKMYAEVERSAEAVARAHRLAGPAAAAGLGVPGVIASVPERQVVVSEAMPGRRLDEVAGAELTAGLRALGRALARLHALPSDAEGPLERFTPDALQDAATLLARVRPDVAVDAHRLAERLRDSGPFPGSALLHGDVHLKNALLAGDEVNLVDLDQCARGHPAADVGSLLGSLRHRRLIGGLTTGELADLEAALLAGYFERAEIDPTALRWHTAAALLVERAERAVHRVLPESLMRLPALLGEADALLDRTHDRRRSRRRRQRGAAGTRSRLLFYCQHSVGIGHLVRSLALAEALSSRFDVVLLSGGAVPPDIAVPPAVRLVTLPALGHDSAHELVSRDPRWSLEDAKRERVARILDELRAVKPAAVVVELYPFGRRKFAFELLPLLEASRALVPRPVVLSSVRDILVSSRRDQARHDEQASIVANRWFDGVLVHADPRFARLEESFSPRTPLNVPVHYTGFVRRQPANDATPGQVAPGRRVCVSAGGGLVGRQLFDVAVDAAPALLDELGLHTVIVTGPFLPAPDRVELEGAAAAGRGCTVVGFVPDLAAEIAASAVSVSQCGYNTVMDVLSAGTPAVVVPYAAGREDEQLRRARRLEALGIVALLEAGSLSVPTLVDAVRRARRGGETTRAALRLDGAPCTAALVASMIAAGAGRGAVDR